MIGCASALVLSAFFDRRQIKHVLVALAIAGATLATASSYVKWSLHHDGSMKVPEQFGRRLFFNVYLEGGPYARFEGPAADTLRSELIRFFQNEPPVHYVDYVKSRIGAQDYQDLFKQYDGRTPDLVNRIFADPNRQYYEALFTIPDEPGGIADRIFLKAALEFIFRHPVIVVRFVWSNFEDFTVGQAWACQGSKAYPACKFQQADPFFPSLANEVVPSRGNMPERAYSFLTSRAPPHGILMHMAEIIWKWEYYNLRPALLALVLVGWLHSFWCSRAEWWTTSTIVAVYLANTMVFSLFVGPEFRYQIPGIATSAFAAGTGIFALLSLINRVMSSYREKRSSVPSEA
jgi:hypothetical protein